MPKNICSFKIWLTLLTAALLNACASSNFESSDVEDWQPPTTQTQAPKTLLFNDKIEYFTVNRGFANFLPIVPTFNNKGKLLASWNPHSTGVKGRPTFIVMHGGHGIGGTDTYQALWARKELKANVLVLDSYWSRGRLENWKTNTNFGVNMRALDAIAAGRFALTQGVDPDSIFLMGGSQGGWTVLRTFTQEPFYIENAKPLFRGGISLYPNCVDGASSYAPTLGPYYAPVIVFTGGKDEATPTWACSNRVFTQTQEWINYPNATHGFDAIGEGGFKDPPVDHNHECHYALNTKFGGGANFQVCRDNEATEDMFRRIKKFVQELSKPVK